MQRVSDYLATIELERKVSRVGQIQLAGRSLGVGRTYAQQKLAVRCDRDTHEWVVRTADGIEVARLAMHGVDVASLTDLPDTPAVEVAPIQLTLPWFVA